MCDLDMISKLRASLGRCRILYTYTIGYRIDLPYPNLEGMPSEAYLRPTGVCCAVE